MRIRFLAAGFAAAISAAPAAAQTRLEVIVFPGNSALPLYVADDKGFFKQQGLEVKITPTPNSGFQMKGVIEGKFPIAQTAIDNQIAYMEGQGTAKVEGKVDLVTILGTAATQLTLVAQPSVKSYADLKGKTLAVDSLSTGFAFVLRKMLEKNGLKESDYKFAAVGGTRARFEAMKSGKALAALMTEPFTSQARRAGWTVLGESLDTLGAYQGSVHTANGPWARANPDKVVAYIRAVVAAHDWLYDPKNNAEAGVILSKRLKGVTPERAAGAVANAVKPGPAALARKGEINMKGLETVIALREQYTGKKVGKPEKYIDLSYYKKALGQ